MDQASAADGLSAPDVSEVGNLISQSENASCRFDQATAFLLDTLRSVPQAFFEDEESGAEEDSDVGSDGDGEEEGDDKDIPALSYDVFTIIASFLIEEPPLGRRQLRTLANLNQVSKAIHQLTLPYLYERVDYTDELKFVAATWNGNPRGWSYVKYLLLSDKSYNLLKQHLRFSSGMEKDDEYDWDLRVAFPRIITVCSILPYHYGGGDKSAENHGFYVQSQPAKLEIFQPITYETLRKACMARRSFPERGDVLLFGIRQPPRTQAKRSNHIYVTDIVEIVVREGGGVLPPSDGRSFDVQAKGQELMLTHQFTLDIKQSRPDALVESTINLVLDFAKFSWGMEVRRQEEYPVLVEFSLVCQPQVLEAYIAAMNARDRLHLFTYVTLTGAQTTEKQMVRHLTDFSDIFFRKWSYDFNWCTGSTFVLIEQETTFPPPLIGLPDWTVVSVSGELSMGDEDNGVDTGFTASARTSVRYGFKRHVVGSGYREFYPCAHVAVPPDWPRDD